MNWDQASFAQWQRDIRGNTQEPLQTPLQALMQEIWRDELDPRERAVLQGLHLHGKNEATLGRELGLHHSSVGRLRRKGEAKIRRGLGYALRYQELAQQHLYNNT